MNILHIIPRFIGGGPERHLLAIAAHWRRAGMPTRHRIVVLEGPLSAPLVIRARSLGIGLALRPSIDAIRADIAAADVVEVMYWNHPALLELLREELPEARILVSAVITGTAPPQVLTAELGAYADSVCVRVGASAATHCARTATSCGHRIVTIPALADMSRLDGFAPRHHAGVRVGYLGLVEPTKMHPRFAELSSAVSSADVSFDVFGDGTWGKELARRFASLGSGHRVRIHGHTEDLREAFAEIDIFGYPLAPDTSASSEKAVQEAMWAGIPPVVLAGSGAECLIEHDRTGIICRTEDEYPDAIDRLAADHALRRALGDAARIHARHAFDPVRNALRYREIAEHTAGLPARRREPLPGRGHPAASRFVLSLGDRAGPFATSLDGTQAHSRDAVRDADAAIAAAGDVLARGEGGVVHYRNTYPDDPHLMLWSGLIARHRGGPDSGQDDLRRAVDGGIDAWRIAPFAAAPSG